MPSLSGHFTGHCNMQSNISLSDTPGHELSIAHITGPNDVNDENWRNVKVQYFVTSDLVNGNGQQHGYFVNEHPNGDRDCGSCESKVTNNNGQVTFEGTWRYTQGQGQFAGITGGGTFRGRMTSPTDFDIRWEGNYQLGSKTQAA